ncbi:hypothetical protein BS78_09G183700 [Paspalum vaginatum]|nr:hypothetical protein BS78_09G183700 [Paspalum vaginatum]
MAAMAAAGTPACSASELVARGRESAAVLQDMLGQQPAAGAGAAPHGLRDLAEQILRCCDRALASLLSAHAETEEATSRKRKPDGERGGSAVPPAGMRSSKRMRMSRGERGTRVEKKGTMEDGFIWRKYGQKDIHGSNYPRLYFRCTYKDDHGCMARRQVQQSDADPSVYLITYFGEHTCCRDGAIEPPPAPFVINFGCSSGSGSPWPPSCDDDDCMVSAETTSSALCNSPEGEELRAGTGDDEADEFIVKQSTPVHEPMGILGSPEWDAVGGCLDWELGYDEMSSFDIDGFFRYDIDYLGLL